MKATWTTKSGDINFDTVKGTITGSTYANRDLIKEEFKNARWNSEMRMWEVDGAEMESRLLEYANYYKRLYKMETIDSEIVENENGTVTAEAKKVISSELINGEDGFYSLVRYEDGTTKKYFVG